MKVLGISIVVALGLVVALWWTREAPVSRPAVDQVADQPSRARRAIGPSTATHPMLEFAKQERPTLEPTEADPKRRKAQEALWQELRRFASEAELTDAQWDQFGRDLSELAETEATAWANAVKAGNFDGPLDELSEELGHDLEARCAIYMTKKQLSVLRRFRADVLVTRVRQLHFVPFMARILEHG